MSSQQQACQAVRAVLKAAESSRGGSVAYKPYHVYKTLKLLAEGDPLGRPRLQKLLGLGEAPVKTLLQRLESLGLAMKARGGRGHYITESGRWVIKVLEDTVEVYRVRATPLGDAYAIVSPIPRPVKNLVDVYSVRDYLVAENCRVSIIGGVDNGVPHYPGLLDPQAEALEAWDPGINRGLVVIIPDECLEKAYSGILRLISKEYCG